MRKTIEIQRNLIDHFLVKAENDGHATRLDARHDHATSSHSSSSHQKGRKKNVSVTSHDMTRIVYKSLLKKEGKDIFYMPGF